MTVFEEFFDFLYAICMCVCFRVWCLAFFSDTLICLWFFSSNYYVDTDDVQNRLAFFFGLYVVVVCTFSETKKKNMFFFQSIACECCVNCGGNCLLH